MKEGANVGRDISENGLVELGMPYWKLANDVFANSDNIFQVQVGGFQRDVGTSRIPMKGTPYEHLVSVPSHELRGYVPTVDCQNHASEAKRRPIHIIHDLHPTTWAARGPPGG